jgi:hypothetical protein
MPTRVRRRLETVEIECVGGSQTLRIYDFDTAGKPREPAAYSRELLPGLNTVPRRVWMLFRAQFPDDPRVADGRLVLRGPELFPLSVQDLKGIIYDVWRWRITDPLAATLHELLYYVAEAIRDEAHTPLVPDLRAFPLLVEEAATALAAVLDSGERFAVQDIKFGERGEKMLQIHAQLDDAHAILQQYRVAFGQSVEHAPGSDGRPRAENADGFTPVERGVAVVAELHRIRTGTLPEDDDADALDQLHGLCSAVLPLIGGPQQAEVRRALARVLPWLRAHPDNRYRAALLASAST